MFIFDQLRVLESFFMDVHKKGIKKMNELYELVQHAGNIIPRLSVGSLLAYLVETLLVIC